MSDESCPVDMPRLPAAELTGALHELVASGANRSMVETLGHQPERFVAWYRSFRSSIRDGVVAPSIKETARLRIAALNGCPFCMHMRSRGADGSPLLNDADVTAALAGDRHHAQFSVEQLAALAFAERLFTDPHGASDDEVAELRALVGDAGVIELGLAIGDFIGMGKLFLYLHLPAPVAA
jgi:alkylhydroperoxidase family enzyme